MPSAITRLEARFAQSRLPHLLLLVIGLLVWSNSLSGQFVLDDGEQIENNPHIRSLWPPWESMFSPQTITRPLVGLTLAINYAFGELDPLGYRIVNVCIHLLAALTLYGLLWRTFRLPFLRKKFGVHAHTLALIIASLWLVHPLNTMAVTYVIQRMESLMGLFYLFTLYSLLRAATSGSDNAAKLWRIASVCACFLGMATKQVMFTAPLAVLLYDRTFIALSFKRALRHRGRYYAALFLTTLTIPITIYLAPPMESIGRGAQATPWQYLLTQATVITHYLRLVCWPDPLVLDYAWPIYLHPLSVWPQGLALLTLSIGSVLAFWRWRFAGFLGLLFFLILAPTSSILPIADAAAEHRMYLPSITVIVFVISFLYLSLHTKDDAGSMLKAGLLTLLSFTLCIALGYRTILRNRMYAEPMSLWLDGVKYYPNNARAHYNIGTALLRENQYETAVYAFGKAIELDPKQDRNYYNRATAYRHLGLFERALKDLDKTIELNAQDAEAYNARANLRGMKRSFEAALADHTAAIDLQPARGDFYANRAMTYYYMGHHDKARHDAIKAQHLGALLSEELLNGLQIR